MNPFSRGLLGVALGVLLTLIVHPISRAYLLLPIWQASPARLESCFDSASTPKPPKSLAEASLWIQLGTEKLNRRDELSRGEVRTLLRIAQAATNREPDNAFWPQMEAVFHYFIGDLKAAKRSWFKASRRRTWNDYQSARLSTGQRRLQSQLGSPQAWTFAVAYFQRSEAMSQWIARYSQFELAKASVMSPQDLKLRAATLRNGTLMREGSRSLALGAIGSAIVEASTYPPDVPSGLNQRRLWLARTQLVSLLRQGEWATEADMAEQSFRENDAWILLTGGEEYEESARDLAAWVAVYGPLPGLLFLFSATMGGLWLVIHPLSKRWSELRFFRNGSVIVVAVASAVVMVALSRNYSGALIGGACVAFLSFGPIHPRRRASDDLGPLLILLVVCLWLGSLAAFLMAGVASSAPAAMLIPQMGAFGLFLDRADVFRGSTLLVASMLCVTATAYALVHRYATPDLIGLVLRRYSVIGGIGTLVLAILLTPVIIAMDIRCANVWERLVMNEPVYYLTK